MALCGGMGGVCRDHRLPVSHCTTTPHPFASTPLLLAGSDADGTDSWQSLIHDGAVLEMVGNESVRGLPLDAINQLLEGCGRPARLQVGN